MVTCLEWAQRSVSSGTKGPRSVAIEEPEARLHPSLQRPLASAIFDIARLGVPCIIETHSVYLLRELQLEVARGKLRPEDVALHWFSERGRDERVQLVPVRPDGSLEGWRPEVFEEEQSQARAIFEARWRQRGGA
jgi:predicted ATPase